MLFTIWWDFSLITWNSVFHNRNWLNVKIPKVFYCLCCNVSSTQIKIWQGASTFSKRFGKAWQEATYYMQNINKWGWPSFSICALWERDNRSKCWTNLNLLGLFLIILQSKVAMGPQVWSIIKTWYYIPGQDSSLPTSPFSKYWNYFIVLFPVNRYLMFQIQFSLGTFECFFFKKETLYSTVV